MTVNWFNVNMPTILAVVAMGTGTITYINHLESRIAQVENYRAMRSGQVDKTFADIGAQLSLLNNLPYRMGQVEANVNSSNVRMDRIADSVLESVEGIKKDVGAMSTQVSLIGQKQDMLNSKVDNLDVPRTGRKMLMPFFPGECIPCRPLRIVFSATPLVPLH